MNGKDLLDALNEIDDEFIEEVTKADAEYAAKKAGKIKAEMSDNTENVTVFEEAETIKKRSAMMTVLKYAAIAAGLMALVGGGLIIDALLGGKPNPKSAPATREWTEKDKVTPVTEPYTGLEVEPVPLSVEGYYEDLIYNSLTYTRQRAECNKLGEYLGSFQLTCYMYYDEEEELRNQGNELPESVTADVYEIPNVSTEYAVAVKYPDTETYLVYARIYQTDNFADYAKATQLATYMSPREEFSVIRDNQEIKLRTTITTEQVLNTLFRNQDIPIFAMNDMPNEFFAGTFHYDWTVGKPNDPTSSYAGRYSVVFPEGVSGIYEDGTLAEIAEHPPEGSPAAQEFCKGKQIGTMSLIAYVNNSLLGEGGFQVYLYSGGWVVTDFFCMYVGPEAAADFMKILDAQIPNESTVPN